MFRKALLLGILLTLTGVQLVVAQTDSTQLAPIEDFVVVIKDTRLDILDKRPALLAKFELDEKNNLKKDKEILVYKPIVSADGKKKVTGSIYTTKGFRIVIYNGPDRVQAMQVKNNFARAYPATTSSMSYNVPSYKIKVGDFESRNDASKFLRKIGKAFPTAFIVPDIITVKNINVTD
ncbi:MAG: SPOR domain-containing protein [Chitinophagaceae bacterium]|nr:SPOR domain-containing protein [Chitinophagaceae bacterium]